MFLESERRLEQQSQSPNSWIDNYLEALSKNGWNFITEKEKGKIYPSIVLAQDQTTTPLLKEWGKTQEPVEINMVLVMPNTEIADLPARALAYLSTTLNLSGLLLEKGGINITSLRILSPCYWNSYADGGNAEKQRTNSNQFEELALTYKKQYYPELDQLQIITDTGKPVTREMENSLKPRAILIQKDYPDITEKLSKVAARHDKNGTIEHLLDSSLRPLAYLLAHAPAWGYSLEPELFTAGKPNKINFLPASELRYLTYMSMIRGRAWIPNPNSKIATLISRKQLRAPYHPLNLPSINGDITIGDLRKSGAIPITKGILNQQSGRIEVAETITALKQIQTDIEQSGRKKRANPVFPILPLDNIVANFLLPKNPACL